MKPITSYGLKVNSSKLNLHHLGVVTGSAIHNLLPLGNGTVLFLDSLNKIDSKLILTYLWEVYLSIPPDFLPAFYYFIELFQFKARAADKEAVYAG